MQNDDERRCPDGLPTYPTPNASKFASRSRQNRGRNQSSTGPVTELLRCDGFATPVSGVARHFEAADEVGIARRARVSAPMQLVFSVGKNVNHWLTSFCRMACSL